MASTPARAHTAAEGNPGGQVREVEHRGVGDGDRARHRRPRHLVGGRPRKRGCLAQAGGDTWAFCFDTDGVNVVALWVFAAAAAALQVIGVATTFFLGRRPLRPVRPYRATAPLLLVVGSIVADLVVGLAATAIVLVVWPDALRPRVDAQLAYVVFVGVMAVYECLSLSLGTRRTIGMRLSGLDVVDSRTSAPLSPMRSCLRGALLGASCGVLPPIGLFVTVLTAALTTSHRTVHDVVSRSSLVLPDGDPRAARAIAASGAPAGRSDAPLRATARATAALTSLRSFSVGLWLLAGALVADDVAALVVAGHAHTACLPYAPDPCADVALSLRVLLVGIVGAALVVQVVAVRTIARRDGEPPRDPQGSDSASATISLGPDGQST